MSTNNGDLVLVGLGGLSDNGRNESGSSDNVEVGNTEQPIPSAVASMETGRLSLLLGVKDTGLLEGLGEDWNGRVDGVGYDQDESLGAGVGDSLSEGCADTSVDLGLVLFQLLVWVLTFCSVSFWPLRGGRGSLRIDHLESYQASWGHRRG